jgi:hypothetical protein
MLTDLLQSLRARLVGSPRARGRRGIPAARFRPGMEPLDERCLPSAAPAIQMVTATLQPRQLGLLRAFQQEKHLGPLYAALPDLGAGRTVRPGGILAGPHILYAVLRDLGAGDTAAVPNTFVGSVPGTNILVALVVGPREALAYVCDGAGLSAWFRGKVHGPTLTLPGVNGGRIVAQVQGDTAAGTVALHGEPALGFTAGRAVDGASGLFRGVVRLGRQEEGVLSLIRLLDEDHGGVSIKRGSRVSFIDPLTNL